MAGLKKVWKKQTKGWQGTIIYLVLGFLIAWTANMGLGYALQTDTPVVAVFSNSMVPTFYKGDMIVVLGENDVSVGDVIIFDAPNRPFPIIHRVYEITSQGIRTKGDFNAIPDPWVISGNKVHGKAVLKIPILGWVKIIFTQITGLA